MRRLRADLRAEGEQDGEAPGGMKELPHAPGV